MKRFFLYLIICLFVVFVYLKAPSPVQAACYWDEIYPEVCTGTCGGGTCTRFVDSCTCVPLPTNTPTLTPTLTPTPTPVSDPYCNYQTGRCNSGCPDCREGFYNRCDTVSPYQCTTPDNALVFDRCYSLTGSELADCSVQNNYYCGYSNNCNVATCDENRTPACYIVTPAPDPDCGSGVCGDFCSYNRTALIYCSDISPVPHCGDTCVYDSRCAGIGSCAGVTPPPGGGTSTPTPTNPPGSTITPTTTTAPTPIPNCPYIVSASPSSATVGTTVNFSVTYSHSAGATSISRGYFGMTSSCSGATGEAGCGNFERQLAQSLIVFEARGWGRIGTIGTNGSCSGNSGDGCPWSSAFPTSPLPKDNANGTATVNSVSASDVGLNRTITWNVTLGSTFPTGLYNYYAMVSSESNTVYQNCGSAHWDKISTVNIISPTLIPTLTPTTPPLPPNLVCQAYDAGTGTTPVQFTWNNGTGLQVWDNADFWWWNADASSPLIVSSLNNAGAIPGIPPGRTVSARTTYDYTDFSSISIVTCPTPTPTPTPIATSTPTATPTQAPTPWIKLKDSSFISTNGLISKIPYVPLPFAPGDPDDNDQSPYFIIGSGGVVAAPSIDLGINAAAQTGEPEYKDGTYGYGIYSMTPSLFYNYVKTRKEYTKITQSDLSEIDHDGIYYYQGASPLLITSVPSSLNLYNTVLITSGTVDINVVNFNPSRSTAIIAPTINFDSTTSEANGVFIANTITTGDNPLLGLKIKGNLIAQTVFTRARGWADLDRPAVFIVFDPQKYIDLLPYLSTANYDWRQIQ